MGNRVPTETDLSQTDDDGEPGNEQLVTRRNALKAVGATSSFGALTPAVAAKTNSHGESQSSGVGSSKRNGGKPHDQGDSERETFENPLGPGQDPSIVHRDGLYYLVQFEFVGGPALTMRRSQSLKTLLEAERTVVWRGGRDGTPCCELWAPDIKYINGQWYIYFAADDGDNVNHRMYVIESDEPRGPYTFRGQVETPNQAWAIDGVAHENSDGELYFLWSGWPGDHNGQQNIYIAHMSDPWTIDSARTPLSAPVYDWESKNNASPNVNVNEGPAVVTHKNKIYVTYSASGCWTPDYSIGLLAANRNADLLDPKSWSKSTEPVFTSNEAASVYGPGHNQFFTSPDGAEEWLVYHATNNPNGSCSDRVIRAQKVTWPPGNRPPEFGEPVSSDEPVVLPSGDPGTN